MYVRSDIHVYMNISVQQVLWMEATESKQRVVMKKAGILLFLARRGCDGVVVGWLVAKLEVRTTKAAVVVEVVVLSNSGSGSSSSRRYSEVKKLVFRIKYEIKSKKQKTMFKAPTPCP